MTVRGRHRTARHGESLHSRRQLLAKTAIAASRVGA
jgi:hypothetical protein